MSKCNQTPIKGMENLTENEVFWNLRPEHRGIRVALFQLLSEEMYIVGDYYVPAEELFFGTTTMADRVLRYLISINDFNNPKKIHIIQPRYTDGDRIGKIMDLLDYLKDDEDNFFYDRDDLCVVIKKKKDIIELAIWE